MATIIFKANDLHFEGNYYHLFIEKYNPARTNKEREGGWAFELQDSMIEQISALCKLYHMDPFEREVYCIVRHMQDSISENSIRVPKKLWEAKFEEKQADFDAWITSSNLEGIFKTEDIEYIKLKHKNYPGLIKYEGPLMSFIAEAIAEKLDRDRQKFDEFRLSIARHIYELKSRFAPKKTKDSEKQFAFYIQWFFRDQLENGQLSSLHINKESIDKFGAEIMKLSGFHFACDEKDFTATVGERMANFRTWAKEQKKFLDKNGLTT